MIEKFFFKDGLMSITPSPGSVAEFSQVIPEADSTKELFFGPAMRKRQGDKKEDVLGTVVLWVDCDDTTRPRSTLPASFMVWSGHGWHLYWLLRDPVMEIDLIERLNKILIGDVSTADKACWNANRFMRVPGSANLKDKNLPEKCELRKETEAVYDLEDFYVLEKLDGKARHKIATGDSRGYHSRSERDWSVIVSLVEAGASDTLVETIFKHQPCGDKYRDEETNANYLTYSLSKARDRRGPTTFSNELEEREDGYYHQSGRTTRRVSTFLIDPVLLLDGTELHAEDAIVGGVRASGHEWKNVTFTRSAFTGVNRLDRETPIAAWQWLGRDDEVRLLLPHLLTALQGKGLPRVTAAPTLGLHVLSGVPYFVGNASVLGAGGFWRDFEGPIAWLPSKGEHPVIELDPECSDETLESIADLVPRLNQKEVIWPMLGWYAASALKPWLESMGYRFPVLNVSGTRGSGKTTLIQRVMMPLFGQAIPKSYDAGTTRFVMLSCLGSTNAVPIAFSEFRYDTVEKFLRYILLAYDTGHDPRGRADQTTVDYALSAPFSVDGEDIIADPAARERIIAVSLHPDVVGEGSDAYGCYARYRNVVPKGFGGYFVRHCLQLFAGGALSGILKECEESIFEAFPGKLPDRVRKNHTVGFFGACLVADALDIRRPEPSIFAECIDSVFNRNAGRSRTLADDFLEDLINTLPTSYFRWFPAKEGTQVYFQLTSAYNWWVIQRRRAGKSALEKDSISSQMKEAPYVSDAELVDGAWMHRIDCEMAHNAGLDIPKRINVTDVTIHLGG